MRPRARTSSATCGWSSGLVFLLVGLAFKVSAVPFHMWTPDVYEGSATPVTAFFASAPKVAAMALLVRVVLGAFPGIAEQWQQIIAFTAIASMLLGAFAAIGQSNIKRLMAYSSIANIGFALVGLAAQFGGRHPGRDRLHGDLHRHDARHVRLHSVDAPERCRRRGHRRAFRDCAQTNLPMAFGLMALMFSLAGIPPLVGFFAKYYVFLAAIEAGLYALAVVGVLASVVGAYYYLRIVKIMFFDEARDPFQPVRFTAGLVIAVSAALMIVGVVALGPFVDAALAAAQTFRF